MSRIDRRAFLGVLAALTLSGCAARSENAGTQAAATAANQETLSGLDAVSNSRTFVNRFGTVEVPPNPRRIAAFGCLSADTCLALNLNPVAVSRRSVWYTETTSEKRLVLAEEIFHDTPVNRYNLDALDRVKPDVIFALPGQLTAEEYFTLNKFAPVVGPRPAGKTVDWKEDLLTVARFLANEEAGRKLIDETFAQIDDLKRQYPGYHDTDAALFEYTDRVTQIKVYGSQSTEMGALETFGVRPSESLLQFERERNLDARDITNFSRADIRKIKADNVFVFLPRGSWERSYRTDEIATDLGVNPNNLILLMKDELGLPLAEPSPLNLPWAGKEIVPLIARNIFLREQRG